MSSQKKRKRIMFLLQYADDWALDRVEEIVIRLLDIRNRRNEKK